MATLRYSIFALGLALAVTTSAAKAQQSGSASLTHTVVVTVPPRVRVQIGAAQNQLQQQGKTGLAVEVKATRAWALVVGSKKSANPTAQWVASRGERSTSMVVYRNQASQRTPELGGASDSEPVMLTVVAP
ncbi:MAG TPA: hypothetical protein VFP26_10685 [Gemmatimonadaceae bacterium]|jgi:hypothetical protein|nr:hypothetical protein [Gemmatimonadaceae bacterium]